MPNITAGHFAMRLLCSVDSWALVINCKDANDDFGHDTCHNIRYDTCHNIRRDTYHNIRLDIRKETSEKYFKNNTKKSIPCDSAIPIILPVIIAKRTQQDRENSTTVMINSH